MLENIQTISEGSFPITPLGGTYILGVTNALSATLAYFAIERFGRRTLLIFGQLSMGACMVLGGISVV